MKKATIYKADGTGARMTFIPSSSCTATFSIMQKDEIRISFSSTERILLRCGDYLLPGEDTGVTAENVSTMPTTLPTTLGVSAEDMYVWPHRTRSLLGWRYQVTDPYMPSWNDRKRCYDYDITMKAWYMAWSSRVMRLPCVGKNGAYALRDSDFSVTDQMQRHAYLLLLNLRLDGLQQRDGLEYKARLRYSDKRELVVKVAEDGSMQVNEALYSTGRDNVEYFSRTTEVVQYSNTDIISAMNAIADAWECEWWVNGSVIYFGRLDNRSNATGVSVGTEASAVTAQSSSGTYATRLYAYGGTRNIPATYRQVLRFTCGADAGSDMANITDISRLLSYDCFRSALITDGKSASGTITNSNASAVRLREEWASFNAILKDGGYFYTYNPNDTSESPVPIIGTGRTLTYKFTPTGSMKALSPSRYRLSSLWLLSTRKDIYEKIIWKMGADTLYSGFISSTGNEYLSGYTKGLGGLIRKGGVYSHYIPVIADIRCTKKAEDMTLTVYATDSVPVWTGSANVTVTDGSYSAVGISVSFISTASGEAHALLGKTVKARLNPDKASTGSIESQQLVVLRNDGDNRLVGISSIHKGDIYTIMESDLILPKIRAAYWSDADTAAAMNNITEKRLMLPAGTEYVDAADNMDDSDIVEAVKVFDDIYPSRTDSIAETRTYTYASDETDGTTGEVLKKAWNAYQFKSTLASKDFSNSYLLQNGDPLRLTFASGMLAGMSFDVVYNPTHAGESAKPETNADGTRNEDAAWFEIMRNEDYGTGLPNETLYPQAGDTFTLYNYNTSYITDSMLASAERALAVRAKAYLQKLIHNDGTYNVTLKAGWLREAGKWFSPGDRMRIDTSSWIDPIRDERILGYSIHMDIPEDAPQFTLGENARYSRLENIEKRIK